MPPPCGNIAKMEPNAFWMLSKPSRQSLSRGFWRGLAAPALLYEPHNMTAPLQPITVVPLPRRVGSPMSDWERVGADLREAARKVRDERRPRQMEQPAR